MTGGGSRTPGRCGTPTGSKAESSGPQAVCAAGLAGHRRGRLGAAGPRPIPLCLP